MYHPWRRLRELTHIDLWWHPMADRLGATDRVATIVMDPRQSQVERRSTLAHELAHVEHPNASEEQVRQIAARLLIPMDSLIDALRWTEELEEVADVLWVDMDTLTDRLDGLSSVEKARIVALAGEVEGGC